MITPLEPWIAARLGLGPGEPLTRRVLAEYQLMRLRSTVDYVRSNCHFYGELLRAFPSSRLYDLDDIAELPFTTPADIIENPYRFLCVPDRDIERVVTLRSSGTTGAAKCLFFTADDLELTIDFFGHGMSTFVDSSDRVMILMPGERPGSVGDLLEKGLARMGVSSMQHGVVLDPDAAITAILESDADCLVGLPAQVLRLARHRGARALPRGLVSHVLLSADYVPHVIVHELERVWGAETYSHYGMTEMGLGGGVECACHCGLHLREADLYFEVVDPGSGVPLPDGIVGEVVFTTLTRTGMPLVRYRTGDLAAMLSGHCPCGSNLRRLTWIRGRAAADRLIGSGVALQIADLDEALFELEEVLDFEAALRSREGRDVLAIRLVVVETSRMPSLQRARQALGRLPEIRDALNAGRLDIELCTSTEGAAPSHGAVKRALRDERGSMTC